jgi:hypothetical protein
MRVPSAGFISGVNLWLIKVNNLSEPDSIFIGVCRGCMPLDQDPQAGPSACTSPLAAHLTTLK